MQPVCFQTCTPLAQRAASPLEVPHPCNQPATPATLLGCRATFDTSMDDAWDDATFDPLTFDFGLGGLDTVALPPGGATAARAARVRKFSICV